jgi:AraC family transcriptional regulator, regulatory protein of adaptative response / methylated-DNA-[protein]-cysteine methyltransferase
MHNKSLISSTIDTPIGEMIAVCDDKTLYLLEFTDHQDLKTEIDQIQFRFGNAKITVGTTPATTLIKNEIIDYFNGKLKSFTTNLSFTGSDFQKSVWQTLLHIPYGKTISYKEQAVSMNRPKAYRPAANANSANKLAIIVPCHRVISTSAGLGGYKYGLERKKWLIRHEAQGGLNPTRSGWCALSRDAGI